MLNIYYAGCPFWRRENVTVRQPAVENHRKTEIPKIFYRDNIGRREVCDYSLKIILPKVGLRQPVPADYVYITFIYWGRLGGTTW
jgi:hypothetical protein